MAGHNERHTPRQSQEERSRATRAALTGTARRLFAERGYANVSAGEIVAAAGLTRGALYHHYADKKALFQAVFVELDEELSAEIGAAVADAPDPAAGMLGALDAYLRACARPEVVRIALTDAPAVLGWHEWRAIEAEHGLRMIRDLLVGAQRQGLAPAGPVEVLSQLILSLVTEAALFIAHAEDKQAAAEQARAGLLMLLGGASGGSVAG